MTNTTPTKYANLSPEEVKAFRPIVWKVIRGQVDPRDLHLLPEVDSRFDNVRECREGEAGTDVMSPLGLALANLSNNFRNLITK
jgi:hypothetical protein